MPAFSIFSYTPHGLLINKLVYFFLLCETGVSTDTSCCWLLLITVAVVVSKHFQEGQCLEPHALLWMRRGSGHRGILCLKACKFIYRNKTNGIK